VVAAAHIFVSAVLGESYMASAEKELDLATIVETELKAHVPALLCSVPGFDASGRVDDLAAELSKPCASIAIGSAEGFSQAERAINMAVKSGRWVLLKNVHLAPQWLVQLEKKLHSLQPHANFRLFLTMEINPKVCLHFYLCLLHQKFNFQLKVAMSLKEASSNSSSDVNAYFC